MSLNIIRANPTAPRPVPKTAHLDVAEFFCDTIQGENFVGYPATFLRLQHCTMNCAWCDSTEVWRYGNPYTFAELFDLMDQADLPRKLHEGQHLVLTGGSPLKQQNRLIKFIDAFTHTYGFKPYIEVENECTIFPDPAFVKQVDCWNNSPKLDNSGNLRIIRYQPNILEDLSKLENSWFKFVINDLDDWEEIYVDFLFPMLIRRDQIVLMPEGATRVELEMSREMVVELAIKHNVRYTTREHVVLWNRKTGI